MRQIALVFMLVACGEIKDKRALPDGPPGIDAMGDASVDAMIDAPIDAMPATVLLTSISMMPTPNTRIIDFTTTELSAAGVTASNCAQGGGPAISGNNDAPSGGTFCSYASAAGVVMFTFSTPVHAVGISAMDIDWGNDAVVNVTLRGFDGADLQVASQTRAVLPANSVGEEDQNAMFLGFTTPSDVVKIRISMDQNNQEDFDNLVFAR